MPTRRWRRFPASRRRKAAWAGISTPRTFAARTPITPRSSTTVFRSTVRSITTTRRPNPAWACKNCRFILAVAPPRLPRQAPRGSSTRSSRRVRSPASRPPISASRPRSSTIRRPSKSADRLLIVTSAITSAFWAITKTTAPSIIPTAPATKRRAASFRATPTVRLSVTVVTATRFSASDRPASSEPAKASSRPVPWSPIQSSPFRSRVAGSFTAATARSRSRSPIAKT